MDLKVGDLLASIRKSVDDDIDTLSTSTAGESRGTLMRGALREMRINMDGETASSAEEISTLRDRIKRKFEETALPLPPRRPGLAERLSHAAPQIPPSVEAIRQDFSTIMAGVTAPQPAPQRPLRAAFVHDRSAAPALRPSLLNDDDFADQRYAQGTAEPAWNENDEAQDPYGAPQGAGYYAGEETFQPRYQAALPGPLLSPQAEAATESAFRQLSDSILARAGGDRSIEEMTREMLRGMLKQWLDTNLPAIVEDMVREEIERVARRGR